MGKYKSSILTEQSIQNALYEHFGEKKMKYMSSSIYVYDHAFNVKQKRRKGDKWEDDFFFLDTFSYKWSLEIKKDRQDYDREKSKKSLKHDLLMEAYETGNNQGFFLPNYFYYVAPKGMIDIEELYPYSGLIEVDDNHNLSYATEVRTVHEYLDEPSRLYEILLQRFYKKSLADEKKYINFKLGHKEIDKKDAKALNDLIILYDRSKRLP